MSNAACRQAFGAALSARAKNAFTSFKSMCLTGALETRPSLILKKPCRKDSRTEFVVAFADTSQRERSTCLCSVALFQRREGQRNYFAIRIGRCGHRDFRC